MDELPAIIVVFFGAGLMVGGAIMEHNASGAECSVDSGLESFQNCMEEAADQVRTANLMDSMGYPILLFGLALVVMSKKYRD